jgi:hypothetical protein
MDAFRHAVNAFLRVSVGGAGGNAQGAVEKGPRGKGSGREQPATAVAVNAARKVSTRSVLHVACYSDRMAGCIMCECSHGCISRV